MYTILLSTLIGFLCSLCFTKRLDIIDTWHFIFIFFFSSLGFLLGICIATGIGNGPYKYALDEEKELVAFKDNIAYEGSFILASGSFGLEPQYLFYEKDTKSGEIRLRKKQADSDQVSIIEEGRENGVIRKYKAMGCIEVNRWGMCSPNEPYIKYVFHVPKGTVTNVLELDLK